MNLHPPKPRASLGASPQHLHGPCPELTPQPHEDLDLQRPCSILLGGKHGFHVARTSWHHSTRPLCKWDPVPMLAQEGRAHIGRNPESPNIMLSQVVLLLHSRTRWKENVHVHTQQHIAPSMLAIQLSVGLKTWCFNLPYLQLLHHLCEALNLKPVNA